MANHNLNNRVRFTVATIGSMIEQLEKHNWLPLPVSALRQIRKAFLKNDFGWTTSDYQFLQMIWKSLWYKFCSKERQQTINPVRWAFEWGEDKLNIFLIVLSRKNYIITQGSGGWMDCNLNNQGIIDLWLWGHNLDKDSYENKSIAKEAIDKIRNNVRFDEIKPCTRKYVAKEYPNGVPVGNKRVSRATGGQRLGFVKQLANTWYQIDTAILNLPLTYTNPVTNKIYNKTLKELLFFEILKGFEYSKYTEYEYCRIAGRVVDWVMNNPEQRYSQGELYLESRLRLSPECQSKVLSHFNKVWRSLIKLDVPVDIRNNKEAQDNIALFVAELLGFKSAKTWKEKMAYGYKAVEQQLLPELKLEENVVTREDKNGHEIAYKRLVFSNSHEYTWLMRIYRNWEHLENWNVPIEIDATASNNQILSVLLNYHEGLDRTNLINGNELKDAYTLEGVSRNAVKYCFTPWVFGSNQNPVALAHKKGIELSDEQVRIINREKLQGGYLYPFVYFRDQLLKNFQSCMYRGSQFDRYAEFRIWNDDFFVHCARHKAGSDKITVWLWDSSHNEACEVSQHLVNICDMSRWVTYHASLLIHNLESQITNRVCELFDGQLITLHDTFIVSPDMANIVRNLYVQTLYELYKDRHEVILNYLHCLGIIKYDTHCFDIDNTEVENFSITALQ